MKKNSPESGQTIYLEDSSQISLHCPQCGRTKRVDMSKFLDKPGPIRFRYRFKCDQCDCGHKECSNCTPGKCQNNHTSTFNLERRKHFRKDVDLDGYIQLRDGSRIPGRIVDLSRAGLKIKVLGSAAMRKKLPQTLKIHFTLEDQRETSVVKLCSVQRSTAEGLECSFSESESFDASDKAIGFYLMQGH